ncbi:MAG TPA: TIGR02221 family CRISPR-associated protein [Candidatus Kapabacteria bacterium]|nr:TIGR02221 family CRISPR-associated protein [Candidatus Kapabacteria bacterium]
MKEIIFILLGTGQKVLRELKEKSYKTAKYQYYDQSKKGDNNIIIETPFVGEAIVRLFPNRFSEVHIFGTKNSMWDVLYLHSILAEGSNYEENHNSRIYDELSLLVENETIEENPEILKEVEKSFSNFINIPTYCHLIPIGYDNESIMKIFDNIVNIELEGSKVSFDITHGLRYQPYFFLSSLFYLSSIKPDKIKLGTVFYGGLELLNLKEFNGVAPLLEFGIFTDLMKWTQAANAYEKYKDFEPLGKLLSNIEGIEKLSEALEEFAFAYKSNYFEKIDEYANRIVADFYDLEEKFPPLLKTIFPYLLNFPNEIRNTKSRFDKLLVIAKHQKEAQHYSDSLISLWEAIVQNYSDRENMSLEEAQKNIVGYLKKDEKSHKNKVFLKLHDLRNTVAHLDYKNESSSGYNKGEYLKLINNVLNQLEKDN